MTNMKKLLMFAVAGLLAPSAANAEVRAPSVSKIIPSPLNDKAPTANGRLKRTDEEQPGNEMATMAFFKDGKSGIYFSMNTELNGQPAPNKMQLAAVPFSLVQATDGSVSAVPDMTKAKFVTNNNGNETRNANHPSAYIAGDNIVVEYNYQPNNTNNTVRYAEVFNAAGVKIMPQTEIYANTNDDCSMNQDGHPTAVVASTAGVSQLVGWSGCNGNGDDAGFVRSGKLTCDAANTACTFTKQFDVLVADREERSHGSVSFSETDPNTVIATWTEGNTQPQRDGTWMAAINVGPGQNGRQAQGRILWKKMVDGRKDLDGIRTYSMRAMQSRIQTVSPTTGKLINSDLIIWRSGDVQGNNNGNAKGGTYYRNMMAVIKADKNGMSYVTPLTDVAPKLLNLDGTHLSPEFALFGTTDHLVPGLTFMSGSHTAGAYGAQVRAVTWDESTKTFADAGMFAAGPYDRHLYPNYLGNNPGNQGRNYGHAQMIANPYVGIGGNTDAYLMVYATTGKDTADAMNPAIKLSAYLTVLPIAQTPKVTPPDNGGGTPPGGGGGGGGGTEPTDPSDPGSSGSALGGCSATNTSSGLATFLLIGLAAFIRRRRS